MRHKDFGTWMKELFPFKVQKISIDAGFSCPNRDGKLSYGGCSFCDNRTFNPSYCNAQQSITQQLETGKKFFSRKYPDMKYLAYFQAFTNTYAPLPKLKALYEEALAVNDVVGIVIGTRPDCIDDVLLDYLEVLSKRTFVLVEYGIESANDETLRRINRGHTFACSQNAVELTHKRGIYCGAHVILGLPGEDARESLRQAPLISSLPIDILKIHQLQIVKGTHLAQQYAEHPFHLYSIDEYLELITRYIKLLRTDLVLDRFVSQCPPNLLVAPRWGIKNYQFTQMLEKKLKENLSTSSIINS
ncbi:MAG: TIGR01212 family radical SAM protein [Prevotella sp.]|jgi:radical SAM protein (TIGR01212 family)